MAGNATPRDQLDRLLLLVRRAMRYWWLVGLLAIIGVGVSIGFAMIRKTKYTSETMIVYRELIPVSALQGSSAVEDNRNLGQRVHDMLLARPRLEQVIKEQKLYPELVDPTEPETGYVEAVEVFRAAIQFRARGAGTFHIAFQHTDPEVAQKVTAQLADLLIADDKQLRLEQANVTTNFLRAERDRLEAELKLKEKELAEFLADHPEFAQQTAGQTNTQAGTAVRAAEAMKRNRPTDPRVSALERQRERLVARLRAPADAPPIRLTPREPSAEMRAALAKVEVAKRDVEAAKRDLDRYLSQYTEKHPDVVAAKKRVSEAERRLADAQAAVPNEETAPLVVPVSNPNERAELEKQLAELDRELAAARRATEKPDTSTTTGTEGENWVVALETNWQRLNREVVEARAQHQQIEGRLFTAQIAASSELEASGARMQIIDPAFRPTKPTGAPKRLIVMAGFVVFFGIGVALAFGLALVDDRIYDRSDIEKLDLLPVLVVVPKEVKAKRRKGARAAA